MKPEISSAASTEEASSKKCPHSDEVSWLSDIRVRFSNMDKLPSKTPSIQRVPWEMKNVNPDRYNPRVVSIGPYNNREGPYMQAMEDLKWQYMLFLLHRGSPDSDPDHPIRSLDLIATKLMKDKSQKLIRQSYAKPMDLDNKLTEVMLIDGCFILELFLRCWFKNFTHDTDPVFKNAWILPALRHDLALFENQIPYFVLRILYKIIFRNVYKKFPNFIIDMALHFFHPNNGKLLKTNSTSHYHHLVHFLHDFYLSKPKEETLRIAIESVDRAIDKFCAGSAKKIEAELASKFPSIYTKLELQDNCSCAANTENEESKSVIWGFSRCATKLMESGVVIKSRTNTGLNFLDIIFEKENGILYIPSLCMDDITESRFSNLIAYEQCSVQVLQDTHHITSYAFLMKSLIQSSNDVKILKREGVIRTKRPRKNEEIVCLFGSLSKEVVLHDFYFEKVCSEVDEYITTCCDLHKRLASWMFKFYHYMVILKNEYFPNPWRSLQVAAAFVLLLLTAIQTHYDIHN